MPPKDGEHDATTPTILVIEDDSDQAAVLEATLQDAGFAVAIAQDGVAGLRQVEAVRPDLAILNLTLPGVSGFRVLHLLKQDPATAALPVLVVTALRFAEAEKVAKEGAEAFLTKPYVLEEVVTRVQALLAQAGVAGDPTAPRP